MSSRRDRERPGRFAWWLSATLVLTTLGWVACSLNPQPIPPGYELEGGPGSGRDEDAAGGVAMPEGGDAADGSMSDAGDAGDASDASDAGDAGDADAD